MAYIKSEDLLPNGQYMPGVEASPDKPLAPHMTYILWFLNPETKVWRGFSTPLSRPGDVLSAEEWANGAQGMKQDPRAYTVLPKGVLPPCGPQPFAPDYDAATHKAV